MGSLPDAISVMPGLVPGIHAVKEHVGLGTPTLSFAASGAIS
jgi:hypothetical protein